MLILISKDSICYLIFMLLLMSLILAILVFWFPSTFLLFMFLPMLAFSALLSLPPISWAILVSMFPSLTVTIITFLIFSPLSVFVSVSFLLPSFISVPLLKTRYWMWDDVSYRDYLLLLHHLIFFRWGSSS